ncbi:hypothetical protein BGZ61DRAFT_540220 [Ilyonectria robusta]|uniref:uncharacterized protein n=1 Tax=Ilyonectria robusta TaxID=1079257 RepID=UPI001E8D24B7|nr:uncharacterized protein BGZ61DRAFT_540220 [Ilyonectria robusta]KAH8659398.1 hypothetical protein BGZ61DRAFT_540220 [Ilyonectria robusta]
MMKKEFPSRSHQPLAHQRLAKNPDLARKLVQMALPLATFVELDHGTVHPEFPMTVLNFWLLTDEQLESLAEFYHQKTINKYTNLYPCRIIWSPKMSLEEKRRTMGKFIGLQSCDTIIPVKTEEEIMAGARRARLIKDVY